MNWYFGVPFFGLFIGVGMAFLYAALRMGTRRVTLKVIRDARLANDDSNTSTADLLIEQANIFGKKHFDLPAGSVRHGACRPQRHGRRRPPHKPTPDHPHPEAARQADGYADPPRRDGENESRTKTKTLGFFTERDDDELRWLAARLRQDLRVTRIRRPEP